MGKTTIWVDDETAEGLHDLKNRGDSYDDVLNRLLEEHSGDESEPKGFDSPEPPEGQGRLTDAVAAESDETDTEALADSLDLPGSGSTLVARRDAVRACLDYLHERGEATKADFVRDVYPDHAARYGSEGGWWNAIGKQGLVAIAGDVDVLEKPNEGEHVWRWVAVDDDRAEPIETDGGAAANLPDVSDELEPLLADVADELDRDDVQALATLLETAAYQVDGSTRLFDDMDNTTGDVDGVTLSLSEASDGEIWVDAVDGGTVHSLGTLDDR